MKCWSCGTDLPDPEWGKVSFRAECDKCGAALHSCKGCRFYHPGLPNDCEVPGTDFISDREKMNFCEDYKFANKDPKEKIDPKDVEKRLFGDD